MLFTWGVFDIYLKNESEELPELVWAQVVLALTCEHLVDCTRLLLSLLFVFLDSLG